MGFGPWHAWRRPRVVPSLWQGAPRIHGWSPFFRYMCPQWIGDNWCVYIYIYLFPVPGSVAPHHPPNGMVPPHYPPKKTLCMLFAAFQSYGLPFACYLHAICSIPKPHLFVAFNSHTLPTKYLGTTNYVLPACCLHIIYMHFFFLLYDQ